MNKILRRRPQLMTILEIQHLCDGKCIWSQSNIHNMWHDEGQQLLLSAAFDTNSGLSIPINYYVGLDHRTNVAEDDTLSSIYEEPTTNGYYRQALSSTTGFTVSLQNAIMTASSGVVTFSAVTGSWGPVSKVFLATSYDSSGLLIATSALSSSRIVAAGNAITVKLSLSFSGCS